MPLVIMLPYAISIALQSVSGKLALRISSIAHSSRRHSPGANVAVLCGWKATNILSISTLRKSQHCEKALPSQRRCSPSKYMNSHTHRTLWSLISYSTAEQLPKSWQRFLEGAHQRRTHYLPLGSTQRTPGFVFWCQLVVWNRIFKLVRPVVRCKELRSARLQLFFVIFCNHSFLLYQWCSRIWRVSDYDDEDSIFEHIYSTNLPSFRSSAHMSSQHLCRPVSAVLFGLRSQNLSQQLHCYGIELP